MKMGPQHPPVESWNPPLVKILFHDMKNWSNDGKKSIFAILAMSQRVADILELVLFLIFFSFLLLYQFPSAAAPHYLISVFNRICQCHVPLSIYVFFSPCKCGMGPGGVHTDISTRPSHKQVYVLFLTSFFLIIKKNTPSTFSLGKYL